MAVGDLPPEPRVIPSLKQAWTNIWPNFWLLLLFGILVAIVSGGAQVKTGDWVVDTIIGTGGALLGIFIGSPLSVGLVKAHLAASRGEKATWADYGFAFGPRYWSSVGLGVLSFLIVLGGLILLIIPGIYWGVRLTFAGQRFVEDGLGAKDSIRASFADVKGRWWQVFGLVLMAIPLFIAGALALGVGIFVAMVLISQMATVYWRSLAEA